MVLEIKTEGIREIADALGTTVRDAGNITAEVMEDMGPRIASIMQRQLAPHRYTGELEESITWRYNRPRRQLRVGTNLQRGGQYQALALLERGTGPISSLPFTPIAKWAAFKGIPAGPVWMSIKKKGVKPHPIMGDLQARPEFIHALNEGSKKLGIKLVSRALGFRKGQTV